MSVTIRVKRGTATQWAARTTPLLSGEFGYDLTNKITKIGDGTTLWASLPSIDPSSNGTNTGDITFDGVQIIGAGTASGDGYGNGTIELVPDADINTDQYLIIDPTAPNHIHIRGGGTQDASGADLFIGGERNNVRVSDGARSVYISTRPETIINTYTNLNETSNTSFVVSNTANIYVGDTMFYPGGDIVTVDSVTTDSPSSGLQTITANLNGEPASFVGGAAHVFSHEESWDNYWQFGSDGVLHGPGGGTLIVSGISGEPGDDVFAIVADQNLVLQHGVGGAYLNDSTIANNHIATMGDIADANEYTDQAVAGLGNSLPENYVPISDVGAVDGVASLDSNGKIPDSELASEVTRNTAAQTLTNKVIGLGTGITSISAVDNIEGLAGQNNIPIYQAGLDRGGRINISSLGVISVATSGIGYVSGLATNAGGTRFNITVGGNAISGTLVEFNAALTDGDFATESYVSTAISNLIDTAPTTLNTLNELAAAINDDASFASTVTTALGAKAPIASPTFTGTVSGITKSMVDLGNVDNTTDANKPVSTATQTALDLKLNLSDPSVDYYITNSGSGAYLVNGVSNGLITFEKGKKYRIHVNATGHPFWIQTVSGAYSSGNVYSTGITNGGAQAGHILVELPQDAPDNLYYACQFHSSMSGSISVQSDNTITINSKSAGYTILPIDSNRLIEMSAGGTLTITDSASFPVGFTCDILQTGASQVTIAGTSFTPNATPGLKLRTQWSSATLIKRALNSWVVLGDLSA